MAISRTHHAFLLPSPGMGHLIPALELAKRLVTHQIIPKLTFFYTPIANSTPSKAETQVLHSAIKENLFDVIQQPPLDLTTNLHPHATAEDKIAILMHELPHLFVSTISTININPTIIITDFFICQVLTLVQNLNLPMFAFSPTNAWLVALGLHTPTLDKQIQGEYVEEIEPISIPGCKPIYPKDMFQMLRDRTHRLYHEFIAACEGAALANAIFVNTFHELEPKTLEALGSAGINKVPVYPIGPIVREPSPSSNSSPSPSPTLTSSPKSEEGKRSEIIEWLNRQEDESVVFVSLGSGYTMSREEIKEMALGLELSGNKFVWSLRPSVNKAGHDHYLTSGDETGSTNMVSNVEKLDRLPDEFHRIQSNGIVITDWAPQMEILKHPSIGGFVSHCGWNSVMESVSCGVPIVGLPIFADQMMNATMLVEEVGNAVRVEVSPSTNIVQGVNLAKSIRKIMDKDDKEGSVMRERAKQLKQSAQRAWSHDGSSYSALFKIAL